MASGRQGLGSSGGEGWELEGERLLRPTADGIRDWVDLLRWIIYDLRVERERGFGEREGFVSRIVEYFEFSIRRRQ